jgi:DNA-binding beta-propeller fold protein YncE
LIDRESSRRLAATVVGALSVFLVVVPGSSAQAATFVKNIAGSSVAATYPSGAEWDDFDDRIVVADTGLDRVEFYTFTLGATPASGTYTKTGQFGQHGTANGQFDSPRDAAVDPSNGDIYVADAGNNRLQKFNRQGTWQWTVGGIGSCNPCLNTPIGVTFDAQNDVVLVASTGQSLIKAFTPAGVFAWKSPTGTSLGIGAPRDAIRGPDGRLWIDDYKHHQVKAYTVTAGGTFQSNTPVVTLGDGLAGGHGNGQVNFPYDVDFSLDGKTAYVADTGNNRVATWHNDGTNASPNWTWAGQIGGNCPQQPDPCPDPPADLGTIDTLRRVVVDESGDLITADFWGNGLQVWLPNGSPALEIELVAAPAPGFAQAFGVACGSTGIYGVDRLNQRVERFDSSGSYLASGGSRGTAPRFLSWPEAVAVDPSGTYAWVGDTRNDRIVRWNANLSKTPAPTAFGGTGSGVGQFNYIEDLDVAPDGRVWVADTNNDRIQIFTPGANTFSVFSSAVALSTPQGVAVGASSVFVADTGNDRIAKLNASTGALQATFTGVSGAQGVALAGDGTVWVADSGNDRILHLSADLGTVLEQFGASGGGNLGFDQPHSLAVCGSTLYVADTFHDRLAAFNVGGGGGGGFNPTYDSKIFAAGGIAPVYPAGGATDASGNRFIADSGGSRIVKIDPSGTQTVVSAASTWNDPRDLDFDDGDASANTLWVVNTSASTVVQLRTDGTILKTYSGFLTPYGLSNDASGVYVADTYNQRVVKIDKGAPGGAASVLWSKTSACGTAFLRPRDTAVGSNGDVFVADTDNKRVVELNSSTGNCVASFTVGGTLKAPRSLTSDGSGGLWIADAGQYKVVHTTNAGALLGSTGAFGEANNQFRSAHCVFLDGSFVDVCDTFNYRIQRYTVNAQGAPVWNSIVGGTKPANGGFNGAFDVTYDAAGNIYAVDWFNHRIEKFDANGNFLTAWGGYGSPNGSFIFPRGVTFDPTRGQIVVTDSENNRIDTFTTSGGFVSKIKPTGDAFLRPYQTAMAPNGDYWVVDTQHGRVLRLDATGAIVRNWNNGGALKTPKGIAVDEAGNVYVSNTGTNKVQEFSFTGTLIATFSVSLKSPMGLRIVGSGSSAMLLIADSGNNRVVATQLDGTLIGTFGSAGSGDGQLSAPQGVGGSPVTGDIAVADLKNNRISIWTT